MYGFLQLHKSSLVWAECLLDRYLSILFVSRYFLVLFELLLEYADYTVIFQALDIIRGKSALVLMDSSLEGQYENDAAATMIELASKCLQYESRDRPDIKFLLEAVDPLQKQKEVYFISGVIHEL